MRHRACATGVTRAVAFCWITCLCCLFCASVRLSVCHPSVCLSVGCVVSLSVLLHYRCCFAVWTWKGVKRDPKNSPPWIWRGSALGVEILYRCYTVLNVHRFSPPIWVPLWYHSPSFWHHFFQHRFRIDVHQFLDRCLHWFSAFLNGIPGPHTHTLPNLVYRRRYGGFAWADT